MAIGSCPPLTRSILSGAYFRAHHLLRSPAPLRSPRIDRHHQREQLTKALGQLLRKLPRADEVGHMKTCRCNYVYAVIGALIDTPIAAMQLHNSTHSNHIHTYSNHHHMSHDMATPQLSCMHITKAIGRITARPCSVPTAAQRHSTIMSAAPQQIGANKQFNGINRRFKHASTTLGNNQHASIDTTTIPCHTIPGITGMPYRTVHTVWHPCRHMNRSSLLMIMAFPQDAT